MTLIEVIIYTMLLSFLMTSSISFAYDMQLQSSRLNDEILEAYEEI